MKKMEVMNELKCTLAFIQNVSRKKEKEMGSRLDQYAQYTARMFALNVMQYANVYQKA